MKVEVEIDPAGVFVDFKDVQKRLVDLLAPLDHAMVLDYFDPLVATLRDLGFRTFCITGEPTTENLAQAFFDNFSGYRVVRVTVFETSKYSATVRRS